MVPTFPTRAWTGSKLISSCLSEGLSNHTILLFEKTRYFGVLSLMLVAYSSYFVTVLSIFNPFPLDPPCSQSVSNRYSTTLFNPPLDQFKLYSSLLVINRTRPEWMRKKLHAWLEWSYFSTNDWAHALALRNGNSCTYRNPSSWP